MGSLSTCARERPKAGGLLEVGSISLASSWYTGVAASGGHHVWTSVWHSGERSCCDTEHGLRADVPRWLLARHCSSCLCPLPVLASSTGGGESAMAGNCSLVEMLDWGMTFPRKVHCIFLGYWLETKRRTTFSTIKTLNMYTQRYRHIYIYISLEKQNYVCFQKKVLTTHRS